MEFISAEEFLKQPNELQKVFLDWWEPSVGDLYKSKGSFENCIDCCTGELISGFLIGNNKKDVIPLLVEGQLRQFIEDKTGTKVQVYYNGEYTIDVGYQDEFKIECWDTYKELGNNLLQAYWKAALKIAKEEQKQ